MALLTLALRNNLIYNKNNISGIALYYKNKKDSKESFFVDTTVILLVLAKVPD